MRTNKEGKNLGILLHVSEPLKLLAKYEFQKKEIKNLSKSQKS
jgi:hypothetical protein